MKRLIAVFLLFLASNAYGADISLTRVTTGTTISSSTENSNQALIEGAVNSLDGDNINTSANLTFNNLILNGTADLNSTIDQDSSTTTGIVLDIVADSLTTGNIAKLYSNSAETDTRNLVSIVNDNSASTGTTPFAIQQDAAQRAVFIDQNGNGISLSIDSEATSANVFSMDTPVNTTGDCISIEAANSLTTGRILDLRSDSSDTSARQTAYILNNNTAATGCSVLHVQQNAAMDCLVVENTSVSAGASMINFLCAGATNNTTAPISTLTTSGAVQGHIQIEINSVKRWIPYYADPS